MYNKPCKWSTYPGSPVTYIDEYWIGAFNPYTRHIEYFQTSLSSKPMYSLCYAKYCLKKYTDMYPGYSKLWIEPAYRLLEKKG